MFVDLVGSTELSARLDPEDMARGDPGLPGLLSPRWSSASTATSPSTWATACWPISAGRGRTRTRPSGRCGPGSRSSTRSAQLATPDGEPLAARVGHRHRPGHGRRADRRGRGPGADGGRRDAQPGGPAAGAGGAGQRRDQPGDPPAGRRPVRAGRSRPAAAQGLRRAGAGLAGRRRGPCRRPLRGAARRASDAAGRPRARARHCCSSAGGGPRTATARWCCCRASPGSASRASSGRCASGSATSRTRRSATTARRTIPTARSIRSSASWSARPASTATSRRRRKLAKLEALLGPVERPAGRGVPLIAALLGVPTGERYPAARPDARSGRSSGRCEALVEQLAGLRGAAAGAGCSTRTCTGSTRRRSSCWACVIERVAAAAGAGGDHLPAGVPAALDRPRRTSPR